MPTLIMTTIKVMIFVLLLFTYIIENELVEVIQCSNAFTNNKK